MVESGEFIKQLRRFKSWFWNSNPAYASADSGICFLISGLNSFPSNRQGVAGPSFAIP